MLLKYGDVSKNGRDQQREKRRAKRRRQRQQHRKPKMLSVISWVLIVGLPVFITYLTVLPRLSLEPLEPLNPADALTAPFELKNEGFFYIRNVTFRWMPRDVHYENNASVSGFSTMTADEQLIRRIAAGEKATVKNVLPLIFGGSPVTRADLEVGVSYQPPILPIHIPKRFRFGTAKDHNGLVKWFHRPVAD